jgi:hypothetical protein
MDSKWYSIKDFHDFVDHARMLVFKTFGMTEDIVEEGILSSLMNTIDIKDQEAMNRVLSHEESCSIVEGFLKKQKKRKNNSIKYSLNQDILMQILESLNSRMISNILNKLVNEGILESGFDAEANDFTFWISEKYKNEKNNSEKPETD